MDFDQLWEQVSREDLWEGLSDWQEHARRARVVVLLGMHHGEEVPLSAIATETGETEEWVSATLAELEQQGTVILSAEHPRRYRIADERRFLEFVAECCHRASVATGHLSALAKWTAG